MSDPRAKGGKGGAANAKAEPKKQTTQSARAGLQVSINHLVTRPINLHPIATIASLDLAAGSVLAISPVHPRYSHPSIHLFACWSTLRPFQWEIHPLETRQCTARWRKDVFGTL